MSEIQPDPPLKPEEEDKLDMFRDDTHTSCVLRLIYTDGKSDIVISSENSFILEINDLFTKEIYLRAIEVYLGRGLTLIIRRTREEVCGNYKSGSNDG